MRIESITSAQNPKIKEVLSLGSKSKLRRETGLFLVEGRRELERCLGAGFIVRTLFRCPEVLGQDKSILSLAEASCPSCVCFDLPKWLYAKIAYREGTEGLMGVVEWKSRSFEDIPKKDSLLIVVLEAVEKPGNLGAVLRSADAAGADAVLVCDPLTDLYNPNLIRSSTGAIFTVPTITCTSEEAIRWLKSKEVCILTAQLQDSSLYYDCDMTGSVAIVMGTEATGLTTLWRESADARIRIPMLGTLDSLNVSVSAAILLFEVVRQRHA